MTRIAVDIRASVKTLEQLRGARDGMQHGGAELIRPHFGLFPPEVLAFMVPAQLQLGGGLHAGATAIQLERRQLAARVAAFQMADGGAVDPAVQAVLEERVGEGGIMPGFVRTVLEGGDLLADLGDAVDVYELGTLGVLRVMELGMPKAERLSLAAFHEGFESKVIGRTGGKVLSAVGIAMSLKSNYEHSGASTGFGKVTSSLLGTAVPLGIDRAAGGVPVGGGIEVFTQDFLAGTQDATVVVVESGIRAFTDPHGAAQTLEKWTEDSLAGKRGWAVRELSEFGYGLGGAIYDGSQIVSDAGERIGGAIYDGGQAIYDAGERLGGSLHNAAQDGAELLNRIPRPGWLGG